MKNAHTGVWVVWMLMVGGGKGLGGEIKGQLVQLGRLDLRRLRYSKISCIWQLGIGFGEWFWPELLVMRGENNGCMSLRRAQEGRRGLKKRSWRRSGRGRRGVLIPFGE